MTRLDQNRAAGQLAKKSGQPVAEVTNVAIWGNHSATQYPDAYRARIGGRSAAEVIGDETWIEKEFIPTVQQRGAAIIEARGASSAASAASAAIDHVHDWVAGTASGDWVSMAIPSDGSYGVAEGLISSFPVTTSGGQYQIVGGLELDEFSRGRIDASVAELGEERAAVRELGLIK
jgi:malate dehydrogenase